MHFCARATFGLIKSKAARSRLLGILIFSHTQFRRLLRIQAQELEIFLSRAEAENSFCSNLLSNGDLYYYLQVPECIAFLLNERGDL
jgi:hypothetical protein